MNSLKTRPRPERQDVIPLALIMSVGLMLRIWAGSGGIWLDEAWSVVFAQKAGSVVNILFGLHHDNNHHLNSLWLFLVGPSAPPLVMRGPAILCSTLTIAVAAAIARPAGRAAAVVTAALFALSPFMILYGSEARGYAPAILAILMLILLVQDWLAGAVARRRAMGVTVLTGTFCHLIMLPAFAIILAWAWVSKRGLTQPIRALRTVFSALDLATIGAVISAAAILGGAALHGGMVLGGAAPYATTAVRDALLYLTTFVTGVGTFDGLSMAGLTLIVAVLAGLGASVIGQPRRTDLLWMLMLLVMPLLVLSLSIPNSGFARYYALSGIALLFLIGMGIGRQIEYPGIRQTMAIIILAIWGGAALHQDLTMLETPRGAPDRPVAIMKSLKPKAATVSLASVRAEAQLRIASAQRRYVLRIVASCDADFHLSSYHLVEPQDELARCTTHWRKVATQRAIGPTGEAWTLYAREGLQSTKAVANGLPPTRRTRPRNARAGVAQG